GGRTLDGGSHVPLRQADAGRFRWQERCPGRLRAVTPAAWSSKKFNARPPHTQHPLPAGPPRGRRRRRVLPPAPVAPPGPIGKFLLTVRAAVAELQAGLISKRTRAALAAYKARGSLLGAARPGARRLAGGANSVAARRAGETARAKADEAYADILPLVAEL